MILCPDCGFENIEGSDECQQCGQSLTTLHLAEPATDVERSLLDDRVGVLNPKLPVAVTPETPVGEVLQQLVAQSIGCVIVVENEELVGIFSERDALQKLNVDFAALREHPVSEYMTSDPQTLAADSKVAFAVQRMDLGSYRHVPIVDNQGRPVGIVSVRDILRYLADKMGAVEI